MELFNGDCLEKMKDLETDSVDLLFCDLPYCGITNSIKNSEIACKWNTPVDLDLFWKEANRVCKINAPMFFTCSTKFGVSLINSNPKNFRYDMVWVKSSPTGFLNAKKMPMKKHEMVYVFYRKLPFYNIADNHTHKFMKERPGTMKGVYSEKGGKIPFKELKYDPPLPTSVMKEPENEVVELCKYDVNKNCYGGGKEGRIKISKDKKDHQQKYDPPLPTSVMKEPEDLTYGVSTEYVTKYENRKERKSIYDPPLPTSVMKEPKNEDVFGSSNEYRIQYENRKPNESIYDPPLPNSILEIASQKGKHSTQKPTALMEWVLKYYTRENDLVLDPTMGSGSTGVACKNTNRKFIGIEKDIDIFKTAVDRLK